MFTNLFFQLSVLFTNKFSLPKTFLISSLFVNDNNVFMTHHKKTISARKIQRAYRLYKNKTPLIKFFKVKCYYHWNYVGPPIAINH
jgi:hypothetical protein